MAPICWWNEGDAPLSSPFALDTETELIRDPLHVPALALATAHDGSRSVLIHPDSIIAFLAAHKRHVAYLYNASFDFWVIDKATGGSRDLWDMADAGRFLCLRLLWRLIKLAETGIPDQRGNLAACLAEFRPDLPPVDKADPYRLRYAELIGLPPAQVESHPEADGFLSYALHDAEATHALIAPMTCRAVSLMKEAGYGKTKNYWIAPDAVKKYGPLSVALQTRADIVLEQLSREPLRIDTERLKGVEVALASRISVLEDELEAACPGIWHTHKPRRFKKGEQPLPLDIPPPARKRTPKGMLQRCQAPLVAYLTAAYAPHPLPTTPKGRPQLSAKDWRRLLPHDEFIKRWDEYEKAKKRLGTMLLPMKAGIIHANYETLLRTGRTSASKHKGLPSIPIQQVPRDNSLRTLFLADEGMVRSTIDYSYLEIRTLAAAAEARFGGSKMAEAVRNHTKAAKAGDKQALDPHQWMAAVSNGLTPSQFLALPPAEQKAARQKAKVANFGLPGGLGAKGLMRYAALGYGVKLSLQEAQALRKAWLDAFPEMQQYLADNTIPNVARNLQCPVKKVVAKFGSHPWNLRSAIQGWLLPAEAAPVIAALYAICQDKDLAAYLHSFPLDDERAYEGLEARLLTGPSATLVGLVRGRTGYCDGANLPFQGLAAAGAKEALWRLLFAGYRVKAFIHDEILVDIPDERLVPRLQVIMDRAMEDVMGHGIPCMTDAHVGPTWVKG